MKLEERLNELIEEKERQISRLEQEIETIKDQFDLNRLSWQLHSAFENDEFSRQMPFPRLEMRLRRVSKNNWYSVEWIYGLVYKHFSDIDNNMLLFIPFSQTTSNGGDGKFESMNHNNKLDLPFRDGLNIRVEGVLFGLPTYIICSEKNICQKIETDKDYAEFIKRMKSIAAI
jgi:hypothetical protein